MKRTIEELEKLKCEWEKDPIWDIEDTEGFEEHTLELTEFRLRCEQKWARRYQEEETERERKAEALGVKGLYRLVEQLQEQLARHQKGIICLADGEKLQAFRVVRGYPDI